MRNGTSFSYDLAFSLSSDLLTQTKAISRYLVARGLRTYIYAEDVSRYANASLIEGALENFAMSKALIFCLNRRFFTRPTCTAELLWGIKQAEARNISAAALVMQRCSYSSWITSSSLRVIDATNMSVAEAARECENILGERSLRR